MATTTKPILPVEGKRNVLVTSALPYSNNLPHLGNVIGSVLSADLYARYCRARGYQTLYVCGTDQYGTATETKALEEGTDPATLCAKYHALHKSIYDWFRIDFDIFDKTPTEHQTDIVQDIFAKLWKNGYIYEDETIQPFCPVETHNTFLADRFVEGECSICGDKGARGDQCDACGSILDPLKPEEKEVPEGEAIDEVKATGWLVNPRCKVDGATPEARKTKHLYLKLDDIAEQLKSWYKTTADNGWSGNAKSITQAWIDKGLKPRAISRDLKWGVPIPSVEGLNVEDYARKVFYVWFDACIGYISITKTYTDGNNRDGKNWEKWWKNPENVQLMQFQGKDNVGFHSIVFPSSLLGTKEKWTKVHRISATEYLNYENGKFSKSRGIGVFGNNAKDTGIDPDIWRWYLLSRRPELADSEFKWEEFIDGNNNELLKNVGNFIQRTLKFCVAKMDSTVPAASFSNELIDSHKSATNQILASYIGHQEANKMRSGISDILSLSGLGNKFLQDNGLNNKLLVEEPERCNAVINVAINHVHLLAGLLYPYMPTTAESIFKQLGQKPDPFIPDVFDFVAVPVGHKIGTPEPLFSIIPAAKLDEWRDAYGGEELKRQKAIDAEKAAAKKAKKLADKERKAAKKAGAADTKANETTASADVSKLTLEEKK
ncbi:putative methionine--tRNA ligase, cytoplasmic [Beauveria bassiana]|uniref:methionine--tRNA ligase n=1 Tax=Beauveria bassiana (strain ARSEF 2860) TaxID=655819 RepID=J5JMX8_BEAB2|nr:methionyl-tRNA synthetase [Beauveria bassiana ARSEF 2860]EJP66603.1 methionyl-tRNA synthetase [Beauveria bassiana ARSEF 2860]KAF1739396.1 putative methionine--tRNA ligase, cytoplasmic [Beauveria bassiana]KAH8720082.1 putative methionine--tRNA ligase, cytoplasmic [Beauveria bassiana]